MFTARLGSFDTTEVYVLGVTQSAAFVAWTKHKGGLKNTWEKPTWPDKLMPAQTLKSNTQL